MTPLQLAISLLNLVALFGLLLYACNAYVMIALHWRHRRNPQLVLPLPQQLTIVTVQLISLRVLPEPAQPTILGCGGPSLAWCGRLERGPRVSFGVWSSCLR